MYQDPHEHIKPLSHGFTLNHDGADRGILLLHGFADTPYSMRDLATILHDNGYYVSVPRLPGHGSRMGDFAKTKLSDWRQCVRRELDALQRRVKHVTIIGRSFGGVLGLLELVDRPRAADRLVLLATPTLMRRDRVLSWILPPFKRFFGEIRKPWVSREELVMRMEVGRYPAFFVSTLLEFLKGIKLAHHAKLERVTTPTLIVHGKNDVVCSPKCADEYFTRLTSAEKEILMLDATSHHPSSIHQNPLFQRRLLEFLAQ